MKVQVVPEPRFELGRSCEPRSLSPLRLPFRHSGANVHASPPAATSNPPHAMSSISPSTISQIDHAM
jgi:hypothetical protein